MQVLPDAKVKQTRSHGRWRHWAFSVVVALVAAGASFIFLSQVSLGLVSGALLAIASFAVIGAWTTIGSFFAARLIALGQGMVWFFLLIHGGLGLLFGPLGWVASAIAGRAPRLAATILVVPAAFLAVSWAPVIFGGLELREGLALLVLFPPALLAAGVLARAHLRQEQEPAT